MTDQHKDRQGHLDRETEKKSGKMDHTSKAPTNMTKVTLNRDKGAMIYK